MAGRRRHWTLRYAWDRARVAVHERTRPDAPWLVREAVNFLAQWMRPDDVVVEFGSGRSSRWLAQRCGKLVSFEDHPTWFAQVKTQLEAFPHASLVLAPTDRDGYLGVMKDSAPKSANVVLVDGKHRDATALWAVDAVKGGLIVVDNANWYLPSKTHAPNSVGASGSPSTAEWAEFWERTKQRRHVWYSNGVWDTLLVIG